MEHLNQKLSTGLGTLLFFDNTMADLTDKFEELTLDFSKSQSSLTELAEARSKLETQLQENKIVLEEFDHLNEESKIYKMTGPVLMPQDYNEAKLNVKKRLEFIESEIQRVEEKIQKEQKNVEDTRNKLLQIKAQMA